MPVQIVPLRLHDYEAMIEVWLRSGLIRKVGKRDERESFAKQLRANRGLYLGAYDGTRLVGTVLGTHDTRKGWINHLAVDPDYQGRGIGAALLDACEKSIARRGIRIIAALIVEGNEPSFDLFRKAGYELSTGIGYVRKKLDPDA